MQKLPPIPTPLETKWREFRYQTMPFVTFCVIVTAVVVMWRTYVTPPNVLAEVEPVTVRVMSPVSGTLVGLSVERFQRVTNGQILGVIEVQDTNAHLAALAAAEADINMVLAREKIDQTRVEQNYLRELLAFQAEQAQLERDRVDLDKALSVYLRASNLFFTTNISRPISDELYDVARFDYEGLKTTVEQNEKRLVEKEKILPQLRGTNSTAVAEAAAQNIRAQLGQLEAMQRVVLRSPIDGTISGISNVVGETAYRGRPIVLITALESSNIIGYARQPLNTPPKVNDLVLIRRPTFTREIGFGRVTQVGTQLEMIDLPLLSAISGTKPVPELGLPFLVSIPKGMNLMPGERVDLVINPKNRLARR
ncbi:MAG: biotin/lipoyl-binding protein [Verrucomicrobia bacterium]|nr:biotin/lipoyl-binding protein [Verrucomicrobiota bacterium]